MGIAIAPILSNTRKRLRSEIPDKELILALNKKLSLFVRMVLCYGAHDWLNAFGVLALCGPVRDTAAGGRFACR